MIGKIRQTFFRISFKTTKKLRSEGTIILKYLEIGWIIFLYFVDTDGCVFLCKRRNSDYPKNLNQVNV